MPSIPLALLADHAVANAADLKLYVLGGGIRSLSFPTFPANVPRLALALGLEFGPDELRPEPHTMRIDATGPGTEPPLKPLSAQFTVRAEPSEPAKPVYFHFVFNLENITLPAEGDYTFSVLLDDNVATSVPLRVERTPGAFDAAAEASRLLDSGYHAFTSGDLAAAEAAFRDVVARFPSDAGGHNNLGFVLLSAGKAAPAIEAFQRARELGYAYPELLDANIGCAHYLLGDLVSAQIFFEQCLRVHGFKAPQAVLFGIHGKRLFPVTLNAAAEYVALMMLNAAWTARQSDDAAARQYVEGAEASELRHREDESGKNFALSLEALHEG
jgi:tetratricopeptide (TPR) repeat protein